MNTRFFVIGGAVIFLLVGFGVFLVYDMNAPVQQVRVYEVPEPAPRATLADSVAAGKTELAFSNQESQILDDDASPLLSEECCPDDLSELVELDDGIVYDSNPVSPEVIEDARRLREWREASALHREKTAAHDAERERLFDELISISRDFFAAAATEDRAAVVSALDEQFPDMDQNIRQKVLDMIYGADYPSRTNEDIRSDLETLRLKQENWAQRSEKLARERPVYPNLTHKH